MRSRKDYAYIPKTGMIVTLSLEKNMKYCPYPFKTHRIQTREVSIGKILIGGNQPIRIQSMTTTNTQESQKTAEQIMKLADEGCEMVRVTVQGVKEALSCEKIKSILLSKGYTTPLIADIHFFPKAALTVADFVDKIRINPGNYLDRRATFETLHYSEEAYRDELYRLEEKFSPLVLKCKERGIALRIGTNHGSLSDRIMNRYGDSPMGMVEAALEFARVCRKLDYHQLVFSMKASNTHVMIQAYRLLVAMMIELGWDYPLHLGVTEAGFGQEGRLKSAVGIGSLLLDGLGDTLRVSLTEDPWHEIDPCKRLIELAQKYQNLTPSLPFIERHRTPFVYTKRHVDLKRTSLHREGSVIVGVEEEDLKSNQLFENLGFEETPLGLQRTSSSVDGVFLSFSVKEGSLLNKLELLKEKGVGIFYQNDLENSSHSFCEVSEGDSLDDSLDLGGADLIFLNLHQDKLHFARRFFEFLHQKEEKIPVILRPFYPKSEEGICISLGAECGALFCDALGEGICIESTDRLSERRKLSFNLLQACRMRSSKTEFISCPSCGRTLFDLQTVTKEIQERTAHLPGVKIAVMGCIVNGPGEMADADFGYVGSKPGKIDLYVGKERVERDIEYNEAVDRLVLLLQKHGVWVDPKNSVYSTLQD